MNDRMVLLKGLKSAAIRSVDATTAQCRLLAGEDNQNTLQHYDRAEVHQRQNPRDRAVDKRAVNEAVYLVEPVAQDRDAHRDGQAHHARDTRTELIQPNHSMSIASETR